MTIFRKNNIRRRLHQRIGDWAGYLEECLWPAGRWRLEVMPWWAWEEWKKDAEREVEE